MTINKPPASNEARLTYDTIERMLSYTNIDHVDSAIGILGAYRDDSAMENLKHTREDVKPVFDDLTDNFEELFLNVMRKSKAVLSGPRPVNFFKPGSH